MYEHDLAMFLTFGSLVELSMFAVTGGTGGGVTGGVI